MRLSRPTLPVQGPSPASLCCGERRGGGGQTDGALCVPRAPFCHVTLCTEQLGGRCAGIERRRQGESCVERGPGWRVPEESGSRERQGENEPARGERPARRAARPRRELRAREGAARRERLARRAVQTGRKRLGGRRGGRDRRGGRRVPGESCAEGGEEGCRARAPPP